MNQTMSDLRWKAIRVSIGMNALVADISVIPIVIRCRIGPIILLHTAIDIARYVTTGLTI